MRNDRAHRAALPRASDPDAIERIWAAALETRTIVFQDLT
jgi:hypothetical protein